MPNKLATVSKTLPCTRSEGGALKPCFVACINNCQLVFNNSGYFSLIASPYKLYATHKANRQGSFTAF